MEIRNTVLNTSLLILIAPKFSFLNLNCLRMINFLLMYHRKNLHDGVVNRQKKEINDEEIILCILMETHQIN